MHKGNDMKNAKLFQLNSYSGKVTCPCCGHSNEGWLSDPRGSDSDCEECEEKFYIPENIDVVIN